MYEEIQNPATIKELYDWAMKNCVVEPRIMTEMESLANDMAKEQGWDDWDTDHPKLQAGSITALLLLFRRAGGEENLFSMMEICLSMMMMPMDLMNVVTVDFETCHFCINPKYKITQVGNRMRIEKKGDSTI